MIEDKKLNELQEIANLRKERLERGYDDFIIELADAVLPLLEENKTLKEQRDIGKETLLALRSYTMGLIRNKINEALCKIDPEVNWFAQDREELDNNE